MGRLLLLIIIGYGIYLLFKKRASGTIEGKREEPREETFRDPVCGVYVTEGDAVIGRLEGERLHFCSTACLEKYRDQLGHVPRDTAQG